MQIAKAGLMKNKVIDCVFIDHCVDLSHNNSVYFDKRANIFLLTSPRQYQSFLDLKRSCEPQALLTQKQGFRFNQLMRRANNLHILDIQTCEDSPLGFEQDLRDETESILLEYRPVDWGSKPVDYSMENVKAIQHFVCVPKQEGNCGDNSHRRREQMPCAA